jgi:hypothetical protein
MVTRRWVFGALAAIVVFSALVGVTAEPAARLTQALYPEPRPMPAWVDHLGAVDEALKRGDLSRAMVAWRDAYGTAVGSLHWQPLAEVADRALRIDVACGGSTHYRHEARQLYRFSVFRARAAHAPDGLRRLAEAFDELGHGEFAQRVRELARDVEGFTGGA